MTTSSSHDPLVNDVARRMTAAPDPLDLRQRVLGRIEPRRAVTGRMPLVVWASAAMAVAAITAIAATVVWRLPSDMRSLTPPTAPAPAVAAPADLAAAAIEPSRPAVSARAVRRPRLPRPVLTDAEMAWRARRIASLDTPAELIVDAIKPPDVSIALLQMKPLATAPLTIAPLDVRTGGGQ